MNRLELGYGVYRTVFDSGSAMGPTVSTSIGEVFGNEVSYYLSTVILLLGIPRVLSIHEKQQQIEMMCLYRQDTYPAWLYHRNRFLQTPGRYG